MKERQLGSTQHPITFLMVLSSDHITGAIGLVSGVSLTVTISRDGGAFASPNGAISELADGWYELAGDATDRGTLGDFLIHATGTGTDPTDDRYSIVAYNPFDAVRLGLTALPSAAVGSGANSFNFSTNGNIESRIADDEAHGDTGGNNTTLVLSTSGSGEALTVQTLGTGMAAAFIGLNGTVDVEARLGSIADNAAVRLLGIDSSTGADLEITLAVPGQAAANISASISTGEVSSFAVCAAAAGFAATMDGGAQSGTAVASFIICASEAGQGGTGLSTTGTNSAGTEDYVFELAAGNADVIPGVPVGVAIGAYVPGGKAAAEFISDDGAGTTYTLTIGDGLEQAVLGASALTASGWNVAAALCGASTSNASGFGCEASGPGGEDASFTLAFVDSTGGGGLSATGTDVTGSTQYQAALAVGATDVANGLIGDMVLAGDGTMHGKQLHFVNPTGSAALFQTASTSPALDVESTNAAGIAAQFQQSNGGNNVILTFADASGSNPNGGKAGLVAGGNFGGDYAYTTIGVQNLGGYSQGFSAFASIGSAYTECDLAGISPTGQTQGISAIGGDPTGANFYACTFGDGGKGNAILAVSPDGSAVKLTTAGTAPCLDVESTNAAGIAAQFQTLTGSIASYVLLGDLADGVGMLINYGDGATSGLVALGVAGSQGGIAAQFIGNDSMGANQVNLSLGDGVDGNALYASVPGGAAAAKFISDDGAGATYTLTMGDGSNAAAAVGISIIPTGEEAVAALAAVSPGAAYGVECVAVAGANNQFVYIADGQNGYDINLAGNNAMHGYLTGVASPTFAGIGARVQLGGYLDNSVLIDSTYDLKDYLRIIGSVTAGACAANPTNDSFSDLAGVLAVTSGTVDSSGNRSNIIYNP